MEGARRSEWLPTLGARGLLLANTVSEIIYAGDAPFTAMPGAGSYLRAHSAANATIAVVGSEPEIYFYAHRHSATGYLYMYPLMEPQPYAARMQREMISEIESNQPDFLVFVPSADSWNIRPSSDPAILKWFGQYSSAHYERTDVLWQDAGGGPGGKVPVVSIYKRKPPQSLPQ